MAGPKRKTLTTDDLMRRQEEPQPKRRKQTPNEVDSSEDQEGEEGEVSLDEGSDEERLEYVSDEEDVEQDGEGSEPEEGQMKRVQRAARLWDTTDDPSSSRIQKIPKPTKAHPTPLKTDVPKRSTFSSLDISTPLINTLSKMSIRAPTEVQTACIPPLLAGEYLSPFFLWIMTDLAASADGGSIQGRDCIGNAKTGSGKTIAFALPILQTLSVDPYGIFALILTPTRELAFQISEQFAVLGAPLNIRTAVVVGGMDMMAQALELGNRPHVVVATPGRIVDHLRSSSGEWDLSRVKFLILDEADRLLTSTFSAELAYLFSVLPKDRQTALFTATWTPAIDSIADAPPKPGKQKPFIHKMIAATETVETLQQYYILVPSHVRESYLYHLLCSPPESTLHLRRAAPDPVKPSRKTKSKSKNSQKKTHADDEPEQPPPTMIFCARARTAAYLTHLLKTMSIRSTALHSRLTQRERLNSLQLFRSSVVPVLICTDVGARGLDIEDVAMVVNWDLPDEPEEYTHRVGRTARAGRGGVAVSFVCEKDEKRVLSIEQRIKTQLKEMELPENKVLEHLNAVSTAKRLANMHFRLPISISIPSFKLFLLPTMSAKPLSDPAMLIDLSPVPTSQVPTPPASQTGSPDDEKEQGTLVSVSTTFFPGAHLDSPVIDLVVLSSDSVFFYVSSHKLLAASDNGFNFSLPMPAKGDGEEPGHILSLSENSSVLNVLLHSIYNMPVGHYSPDTDTIIAAVHSMVTYGISVKAHIAPSTSLFNTLLSNAATSPVEVYALAASFDLYDLAVSISPYLLSLPLSSLTDDIVKRVGPVYLKRLFFLHLGRVDALKRLLLPPPHPHAPNPTCDSTDQKKVTRAWALASAYLAWDARPDLPTASIEAALSPLAIHLTCDQCKVALRERINNLIVQWSVVKVCDTLFRIVRYLVEHIFISTEDYLNPSKYVHVYVFDSAYINSPSSSART
ncbi:hypothetical protein EW146_g6661 [Bondarzewia mesenterica]|uniref:RNA helicase n=1 Tax=Bondarzewia mesenterica TaxID=1095465 RepID=A0A4V3XEH4_9AGAM|nr:hypothetical protein EW146_g6661 [Bondarzewia mesenterica]